MKREEKKRKEKAGCRETKENGKIRERKEREAGKRNEKKRKRKFGSRTFSRLE